MRYSNIILLVSIPIVFLAFDWVPSKAACAQHKAIGWYTNNQTTERSNNVEGVLTHCANAHSIFDIFTTTNQWSASVFMCHSSKEFCTEAFKPNQTYVTGTVEGIGHKPGKIVKNHYPISNKMENRTTCFRKNDSVIEYCFKQGEYISINQPRSVHQ